MGGLVIFMNFSRLKVKILTIVTSPRGGELLKKMAFVRSVCRLPLRSLSWSRAVAGHRLYSTAATDGEGSTSIVKKNQGEAVAEYVAPDQLVSR